MWRDPAVGRPPARAAPRARTRRPAAGRYCATAGVPLASTGSAREPRQPRPGPSIQVPMSAAPRSHISNGGMCWVASSRSSRDERVDVVALEGVDVAGEQRAVRRRPAAVARAPPPRAASVARARCSALFTDADRGVEQLGDLVGLPAQHVAQDQDGALPRRQVLQRGDERQPDRLPRHRPLGRVGVLRQHLPVERSAPPTPSGHGAPRERVLDRRVRRAGEVHRQRPALAAGELVEADVGGDPVEPGPQRRAALEVRPAPARRGPSSPAPRRRRRRPSRACGSSSR